MMMIETLFGGAVLIAALYFLLRLAGLPNYWRGVISGALPALAYAIYAASSWPGLDVMAIHMAVYLATATVLTLLGSRRSEGGQRMHWIPKVIAAFFAALFIIEAGFLYTSSHGLPLSMARWLLPNASGRVVHTAFPGVVPHGEEAAATVSQHLKDADRQRRLGWQVEIKGLEQLQQQRVVDLTVTAHDKQLQSLDGARVTLSVLRPAMAQDDQRVIFHADGSGRYVGRLRLDEAGLWVVVLHVELGQERYELQQNIEIPRAG